MQSGNRFIVRYSRRPALAVCGHWDIVAGFLVTMALMPAQAGSDASVHTAADP
jgi:hypothetical protein